MTSRDSGSILAAWMVPALLFLSVLCFANTMQGEFVWDDLKLIVQGASRPRPLTDVLTTDLWGHASSWVNYYRPLPPLVFALLYSLFGLRPEPFHLLNICLHAGTTVLVFLTARRLLAGPGDAPSPRWWPAFAGAVVFAVHPIHSEAVAWISGVMDVACTFFSVAAIYLYVTRDEHVGAGAPREALSLTALALALLSKEPAVVVPFLCVTYDLLCERQRLTRASDGLRRWGPPFAVLAAYLLVRSSVLGSHAPSGDTRSTVSMLLVVPPLFVRYVQMFVAPIGLNAVHVVSPVPVAGAAESLGALATAVGLGLAAWLAWRLGPVALFGLVVFVLALAPALFLPVVRHDVSLAFAERYLYFPSVGAVLVLAVGLAVLGSRYPRSRRVVLPAIAAASVGLFGMTWSRNAVWKDNLSLWSDAARKSPDAAVARFNLARVLDERGSRKAAIREYEATLTLDPGHVDAHNNLGVLLAEQAYLDDAITHFQAAIRLRPADPELHLNLAHAYELKGLTDEARRERARAAALARSGSTR